MLQKKINSYHFRFNCVLHHAIYCLMAVLKGQNTWHLLVILLNGVCVDNNIYVNINMAQHKGEISFKKLQMDKVKLINHLF